MRGGTPSGTEAVLRTEQLFSADFLRMCLANFCLFTSFYLLLPTLPVYVQKLGGRESEVGLIIGIFTLSALFVRPFVGRAIDRMGRKPFILLGASLLVVSSLLYILTRSVGSILLLRVIHGAGIAFFTTAAPTYIADISPLERRGEAMGYYGMSNSLAMAAGPTLGWLVVEVSSFPVLFLAATAAALAALLLSLGITEEQRSPRRSQGGGLWTLISYEALFPSALFCLVAMTYGSIVSFLPLFAAHHGISNPGLFFTVYALCLVALRAVAGRISDVYGRLQVIVPGMAVVVLALGVLAFSSSLSTLLVAAVLYGVGQGIAFPSFVALIIDRAGESGRGVAVATLTIALDLGISLGSILLGLLLHIVSFRTMFLVAGGLPGLGLVALTLGREKAGQEPR